MNKNLLQGSPFEPVKLTGKIKNTFSHAGFIGFAFLGMAQVCAYILLLVFVAAGFDTKSSLFTTLCSCLQYVAALPVCLITLVTMPKVKIEKRKMKIKYFPAIFAICVLMAAVGSYIGRYISILIDTVLGTHISDPLKSSLSQMTLLETFIATAVFAPIFEEIIFRKLPLDRIRAYGNGPAIFISAVVFGLVHSNIYQFFYAFGIGMIFGYIYVKTGKIIYTVILHSAFNIFGGFIPSLFSDVVYENAFDYIKAVLSGNMSAVMFLVYTIIYYALIIVGIVMVCILAKKVKADFSSCSRELGSVFAPSLINCGMIFVFTASLIIFILNSVLA